MKPHPMGEVLTAIYLAYKHLWKDGKKQIETVSHTFDGDSHNEMTIEVDMTGRKKTDISIFKNIVTRFLKARKFLDFSYKTIGLVDQIHISLKGSKMDKSNLKETIKSEIRKSLELMHEWVDPGPPCMICGKPLGLHKVSLNWKTGSSLNWKPGSILDAEDHKYKADPTYKRLTRQEAEKIGFSKLSTPTPPKNVYQLISKVRNESIIKEESKMIDIKKWWEYEPKKIMSFIYWQQRQIPPIDSNKWNKNWQDVIKQLNHKYPAPELDVKRLMGFKK